MKIGKIGVLIDGLPFAYIVPSIFAMFMQAPEDYSFNYVMSSFLRSLRYLCLILSVIVPAFYVAVMSFHHEMIPTKLAMSIIQSRTDVPFSAFLETLFLLVAFEILIESSMRLPQVIGQTSSIVGGLIVGQAAVEAKIVSPATVIIIAICIISGFVIPNRDLSNAFRLYRFAIFIMAGLSGLFGLSLGCMLLLYHLCSIKTFGIPYMIPYSSNDSKNLFSDTIVRPPMLRNNGEDI